MLHFYAEGCGVFLIICHLEIPISSVLDLKQKPHAEYPDCAGYGAHFGIKCCSEDHLALVADVLEPDRSALGWRFIQLCC